MAEEMVQAEEKAPKLTLEEEAAALGVLVCEVPIKHGEKKGQSARGTRTGYTRHRNVGHKGTEICADCREFHNGYVRDWLQAHPRGDRRVHAVLSDGAEVVRYQKAKAWYIEKGDQRQKVAVSAAAQTIAADPDVDFRAGLDGGAGLEKLLPESLTGKVS